MNRRKYGTAGEVTLASLGGESIFKSTEESDHEEARLIIGRFLDAGGVYIDTSPVYTSDGYERLSEKRFGEVLPDRDRTAFMIATKTEYRTRDDALRDLERSLETLGLDYVDEWRIHHVDSTEELDVAFSDDGVIKAMETALSDGLVKRPSISGHSNPGVLLEALRRYPFQSVLGSLNVADRFNNPFQKELIPYCRDNNIPFIAMKVAGRGKIFRKGGIDSFQDAFNYALSVPGVTTAIVGISNLEQLDRLIECDENFKQLNGYEMRELEDKVRRYADSTLYFRRSSWEDWPEEVKDISSLPQFVL